MERQTHTECHENGENQNKFDNHPQQVLFFPGNTHIGNKVYETDNDQRGEKYGEKTHINASWFDQK